MTLFRAEHKKNYTVVNNFICTDKRLSLKSKAIWLYAFSRPDDWEFHINDIINQNTDGRDSVRSGLKELSDCGYLQRARKRNEDGTLGEAIWTFYETPQELKESLPEAENPTLENPKAENPTLDNHPLLSTECLPSTELVCLSARENPRICQKLKPNKEVIEIKLDEVIRHAVMKPEDWTSEEIEQSWKILVAYEGAIGDPLKFISGTIKNIRNKTKEKTCHQKNSVEQKDSKSLSDKTMSEPASPQSTSKRIKWNDFLASKGLPPEEC